MQQMNGTTPSTDDAQRAEPIELELDELRKIAGGTEPPASPAIVVLVDPVW